MFSAHGKQAEEDTIEFTDLANPDLEKYIDEKPAEELREETNMIEEVYPEFDQEAYLNGDLSPVFFGSAINNFGVKELLDCFVEITPDSFATYHGRTTSESDGG